MVLRECQNLLLFGRGIFLTHEEQGLSDGGCAGLV